MKATGIVRRIEARFIIGFWAVLERSENHSKYASEIHTLLQPKLNIQTVTNKAGWVFESPFGFFA